MTWKAAAALVVLAGALHSVSPMEPRVFRPGDAQSPKPPQPLVEDGLCPFEGCTYGEWTAMNSVLAATKPPAPPYDPFPAGSVKPLFVVNPGEKITALTGTYITLVPGHARIDKAVRVQVTSPPGRPLTQGPGTIDLSPGDIAYTYSTAEGMHTAWFNGQWFIFEEVTHGRIVEPPKSIWWVQIKNAKGQIGWTDQASDFDGIDVLGGPYEEHPRFYHQRYWRREWWPSWAPGVRMRPAVGETASLTLVELQPGAQSPRERHPYPQLMYAIDANLEISIGGRTSAMKPGAGLGVAPDVDRFVLNRGASAAVLLMFEPVRRFDLLSLRPKAVDPNRFRAVPIVTPIDVPANLTEPITLRRAPVPGEQFFYCASGEVELISGDHRQGLSAGEVVLVPRTTATLQLTVIGPVTRRVDARMLRFNLGIK